MGMRIGGGYGGGWANYQNSSSINAHQQRQQGARNLLSALQSGDINAAQTAFTAMQNQGLPSNSPFNAVGQALQSGDLASAQKAAQGIMAARSQRMRGNDGDGDDVASQASSSAATAPPAATSAAAPAVDPSVAFNAFMQNLEAALEQQNPNSSPQASAATTAATSTATSPSTQAVLWNRDSGFNQTTSDATLKADLDSLIQQLSTASATDATATASTSTTATGTSSATAQTTASALQSSFANLIGSLGGQSSSASVMNFLQGLDSSLTASTNSSLNLTA